MTTPQERMRALEDYAHTVAILAELAHKSVQRPYWWLRPSHHKIMRVWEQMNRLLERCLEQEDTN